MIYSPIHKTLPKSRVIYFSKHYSVLLRNGTVLLKSRSVFLRSAIKEQVRAIILGFEALLFSSLPFSLTKRNAINCKLYKQKYEPLRFQGRGQTLVV